MPRPDILYLLRKIMKPKESINHIFQDELVDIFLAKHRNQKNDYDPVTFHLFKISLNEETKNHFEIDPESIKIIEKVFCPQENLQEIQNSILGEQLLMYAALCEGKHPIAKNALSRLFPLDRLIWTIRDENKTREKGKVVAGLIKILYELYIDTNEAHRYEITRVQKFHLKLDEIPTIRAQGSKEMPGIYIYIYSINMVYQLIY